MYILFLSLIILIFSIWLAVIGYRKEHQDLLKLEERKKKYLEEQCTELLSKFDTLTLETQQLQISRDMAARERKIEQERLEDTRRESRNLLMTERERLSTEIDLTRQLKLKELENEYKLRTQELDANFQARQSDITEELKIYESTLKQFKDMQDAINEAIKRKKEIEEQDSFYSIDISPNDQEDISILQSMDARLHNRDVIPKLIWELFIRRPTQEMIKRVVGNQKSGGIYKITYKKTGEAYIGKTTDFSTRWTNHIKTAIGLEAAARATLHNRMAKDGIWNYTFEILEKVDKDLLSSRESYYIDLYGTKEQLNMKSGDKNGTQ